MSNRIYLILKNLAILSGSEDAEQLKVSYNTGGNASGRATLKRSVVISYKVKLTHAM